MIRLNSMLAAILASAAVAGCGGDAGSPGTTASASAASEASPAPTDSSADDEVAKRDEEVGETPEERIEDELEATNERLARAAKQGDRDAVRRAEERLDELSRQRGPREPLDELAADPYLRFLDTIEYKRAPLYMQQTSSSREDHILFVGLFAEQFCLRPADVRRGLVKDFYERGHRRLAADGVDDFVVYVVPLTEVAPEAKQALAVGRDGAVRLTKRGKRC